jgi:hypothetical protein
VVAEHDPHGPHLFVDVDRDQRRQLDGRGDLVQVPAERIRAVLAAPSRGMVLLVEVGDGLTRKDPEGQLGPAAEPGRVVRIDTSDPDHPVRFDDLAVDDDRRAEPGRADAYAIG